MKRLSTLTLALLLLLAAACGSSEKKVEADRAEIEELLSEYLPRLAQVYANRQFQLLEGYAAEKEIAGVQKRIEDLAATGRTLEPQLVRMTVEEVNAWSHSNAYVTTVEVWDLEVYNTGTRQLLSEERGQTNRVKYQLKRDGDSWLILFRAIVD